MKKEQELESICFNCNYFFPDTMNEFTEFGICLNDPVFEPYIDELLKDPDTASCHQLIQDNKFSGECNICDDFEVIEERIEIDDDSSLGLVLSELKESGNLTSDAFQSAVLENQLKDMNLGSLPVDGYKANLFSSDSEKQKEAVLSLGALISNGNKKAFDLLFAFFKELPPPSTISEVHFKIDILKRLKYAESKNILIPILVNELYQTDSNNTTRQWITAIFKFLESCPREGVHEPLKNMLKDKKFSYRLKQKIKHILNR